MHVNTLMKEEGSVHLALAASTNTGSKQTYFVIFVAGVASELLCNQGKSKVSKIVDFLAF
jgi:hypothetical protein